ncbi:MAG: hypothetical protein AW07_04132 [Candidatus Accumulibacter sp. SK-11]|nr:MAG: hypothetical protein AW07_04132 [Candidatus Accumulibacter sp. SK-11]
MRCTSAQPCRAQRKLLDSGCASITFSNWRTMSAAARRISQSRSSATAVAASDRPSPLMRTAGRRCSLTASSAVCSSSALRRAAASSEIFSSGSRSPSTMPKRTDSPICRLIPRRSSTTNGVSSIGCGICAAGRASMRASARRTRYSGLAPTKVARKVTIGRKW